MIGDDAFGRFVLDRLEAIGVDMSRVRQQADLKTGIGVTLSEPDDRAILTYSGSIDATSAEHLTDDCTACRHWHLASYFLITKLRDYWPDWLRRLRGQGVTVSLDTNLETVSFRSVSAAIAPRIKRFRAHRSSRYRAVPQAR